MPHESTNKIKKTGKIETREEGKTHKKKKTACVEREE